MNEYIDRIAPKHCKTSCCDNSAANARYSESDFGGCYRCTLIAAASCNTQTEEDDEEEPVVTREKELEELLLEAYSEGELSKGLNIKVSKALGLS